MLVNAATDGDVAEIARLLAQGADPFANESSALEVAALWLRRMRPASCPGLEPQGQKRPRLRDSAAAVGLREMATLLEALSRNLPCPAASASSRML